MITTGSQNTQDNEENGDYPFYVRSQQVERINKWIFDTEGVVTAGDGVGTGKVFHYVNGKFGLHQRCYLIHNFVSNMSARYFFWIFSNNFYERVHSMTAKSSVDSVRREMIAGMQIPIPPLSEQIRIASALTSIDNLISSLDKLIEKKKAIKEGTMQQLLTGKKRLKGFNGVWKNTSMIDMVDSFNDILDGDWIEAKYLSKTGVRLIQTGNIGEGEYLEKNPKYVTQETFSLLRCREVLPGDLLICRLAEPAGRCCLAPSLHQKMITSVDVTIFRPSNRFDRNFLCYLFNCKEWLEVVAEETRGSTRQRIARKTLENLAIPMPFDKAEQSAIASILFSIDTDIYSLVQKKIKFQKVKQGMMQQLLRGRIRLV